MNLKEIKQNKEVVNNIDWKMTNETAISRYLEWGGSWFEKDDYPVRNLSDSSIYFLINNWEDKAYLYLVQIDSNGKKELAKVDLPEKFQKQFLGSKKGIYGLDDDIKEWVKGELEVS